MLRRKGIERKNRKVSLLPNAKKWYGQNFLVDTNIIRKIVRDAQVKKSETILEIGPGTGLLTRELSQAAKHVVCVEVDGTLIDELEKLAQELKNVTIIHADFLSLKENQLPLPKRFRVIANIPYNISSRILRTLFERDAKPKDIFLLIQKELAERIVLKDGAMSLLAATVHYFAKPKILFMVPASCFRPQPKVESSVIRLELKHSFSFHEKKRELFFSMLKAGFEGKRKILLRKMVHYFDLKTEDVATIFDELNISQTARAEELSSFQWVEFFNRIYILSTSKKRG